MDKDDNLNKALKSGEVIAFETDTVWGIGALPNCQKGIENIYEIKHRDHSKPLILMSDDIKNLLPYIEQLPEIGEKIVKKYFPGAVTIVTKKSALTPDYITNSMPTVGIRVPDHKGFKEICSKIDGHVLATTSANISNEKTSICRKDVETSIGGSLYKIFGNDTNIEGIASTIVYIGEDNSFKILRQGSVYLEDCV